METSFVELVGCSPGEKVIIHLFSPRLTSESKSMGVIYTHWVTTHWNVSCFGEFRGKIFGVVFPGHPKFVESLVEIKK